MVKTEKIKVQTAGNRDIVNITEQVSEATGQSDILPGTVTLFNASLMMGIKP